MTDPDGGPVDLQVARRTVALIAIIVIHHCYALLSSCGVEELRVDIQVQRACKRGMRAQTSQLLLVERPARAV